MFRKLLSRRNLLSHGLCLFIVPAVTCALASKGALAATPMGDEDDNARNVFYTLAFSTGAGEMWAIEVTGERVTTRDIGPINTTGCAALAMSPSGTLLSMCGKLFGIQQLTSFDTKTGQATLFGVPVPGLAAKKDDDVKAGAALYRDKGCTYCHGVGGIGSKKAPQLLDLPKSKTWTNEKLTDQILNGGQKMPPFRDSVTDEEVGQLIAYLRAKTKPVPPPVADGSNPAPSPK